MGTERSGSVLLSILLLTSLITPLLVSIAMTSVGTVEANPGDSSENWVVVSYSPQIKNYAVAVVGAGENIYIANSANSGYPSYPSYFWRYNSSDNTWDDLAVPSGLLWKPGKLDSGEGAFKSGTCLAWDNGDYIYTLFGASYADGDDGYYRHYFYRYSIPNDNWEQLENTPNPKGQGAGDAITWVPGNVLGTGTDWIYAVVGSKEVEHGTIFCRYNIDSNSWEELPYNPSWSGEGSDDGSSLVWAGDNYLYSLQGEWHETDASKDRAFARFDLTDNTWDDLPDILEEGGVGDGGSLVWVGGSYSDNIYALGGGYVGPVETPGENFYCYSISGNSWTQLQDLPYGITDQNGPRLGYANENIYCWRGYYNAGTGDPDVLWAYAVPETKIGVSVSISPSENSDLPCENLTYTVTVTNVGALADNYDLTVSDNENWNPSVFPTSLVVAAFGSENATLSVTVPENAVPCTKDNITVTAISQTDNAVRDNASCIAHALLPKAEFSLATLYKVSLDVNLYLESGLKLVVKFYTYAGAYQGENVIWIGSTPEHVVLVKDVPHPQGKVGVQKTELVLTDSGGATISILSTFFVRKFDLEARFLEIPFYWSMALPGSQERLDLETEFMEIPFYWSGAPPW